MKYKLRPYQEEAKNAALRHIAHRERPGIVVASTGCLAAGTPVLLADGTTKPVGQIKKGDKLVSRDDHTGLVVYNKVDEVIRTSLKPKPMIKLTYENNKTITTTYDHPFKYGDGYYPLYQLAWGELEASQREKLELLCKQYGTPLDHKEKRRLCSCSNEASERQEWVSTHGGRQRDSKDTQIDSRELAGEPSKSACGESHKWGQIGQPSGKPGVVHNKVQRLVRDTSRKNQNSSSSTQHSIEPKGARGHQRILQKEHGTPQTHRKKTALPEIAKEIPTGLTTYNPEMGYEFEVQESQTYYGIRMEKAPYTYYIGEGGYFLTHNSGKSLIIAAICRDLNDNIIVLQPNRELVLQNYEKFTSYAPELEAGIYSASAGAKDIRKVTFATIGSIYKKPELFRHFNYAILDECHGLNPKQLGSTMLGKFLRGAEIGNVIGLTATPYRVDTVYTWENGQLNGSAGLKMLNRMGKKPFFGQICYKIEHKELEQMGYLAPIKYYQDKTSWADLKVNSTGANFTDESAQVFGGRIISRTVQAINYAEKHHKRCLVFCQTVSQAESIQEIMRDEFGLEVGLVTAKTPGKEREELVRRFKSGELKTMLNMGVFTTGFDVPELDCIVMSRATMSLALWYQMIGRGVRLDPSNPNKVLHVYDIANVTEKLGRVETIRVQREAGGFRDEVWSEKGRLDNKIMYTYTINRKGSDAKEKPKSKPKYQKLVPQVGTFMRK